MTPKEKANELGNKFYRGNIFTHGKEGHLIELEQARKYALIAVEQIETITKHYPPKYMLTTYWQEVKQEIQNL